MSQELILNGFYEDESPTNSTRTAVNWHAVPLPQGSYSSYSLYPSSGITGPVTIANVAGINAGPITSQVTNFTNDDPGSVVFAKDAKVLTTDGSITRFYPLPNIGGVEPTSLNARFAATDTRLVMIAPSSSNGGNSFAYDIDRSMSATAIDLDSIIGGVPAQIEDVAFAGGRVVYMSAKTFGATAFRCYYSNIGAAAPLVTNFFAPDSSTSQFRGLQNINGNLYLFTEDRTYLFTITASTSTPFQWQRGATAEVGLLNPQSKDSYKNSIVFVGRRVDEGYKVYVLTGSDAQPISTKAIDYQINEDLKQDFDARVFTFTEKGRDFTAVRTSLNCFVYDHDAKNWHKRSTNGSTWEVIGAGQQGAQTVAVGRTVTDLVTDLSLNIGSFNNAIATEFGQGVDRECTTAHFNDSGKSIRISEIEPQCEVLDNSPGASINLSVSTDYGRTFSAPQSQQIGRRQDQERTRFMQLGLARDSFTVRLSTSSLTTVRVIKILARLKTGVRER